MKLSRLKFYFEMCSFLEEKPTLEGAKFYDKCVDKVLKEFKKYKVVK